MYVNLTRTFGRIFPTPRILSPHAAGIDITDASIKWVTLAPESWGASVVAYGQQVLPPGIVEGGAVKNTQALAETLKTIKKQLGGASFVHAALPEEGAYVFNMHVPDAKKYKETLTMVEFELEGRVPIPVPDTVYDYEIIEEHRDGSGSEIGVVAFAREIAEGYAAAFEQAGLGLLSLEVEARSIARAVSAKDGTDPITLLVDSGRARTGVAILKHGVPIFTSTVDVGGAEMTKVVMETLSLSEADAEKFKNEEGLVSTDPKYAATKVALEKVASLLADEVVRHYRFWDTRRNEHGERVTPVEKVYLVGGTANLKGITDFIAAKVHAPTDRPNVWRNVTAFDAYVPPIDRRSSFQYVTAIGLALRSIPL